MIIQTLIVGPVATCCYLLRQDRSGHWIVIDPGDEPARIKKVIGSGDISAILLTHGHFDHIGAVSSLMEKSTKLFIHRLDAPMLTDSRLNASLCLTGCPVHAVPPTDLLSGGEELSLAGISFSVIHTPGHTPGSVCYRFDQTLFTGDTLFHPGWGRTDLPGGDQHALYASLRRIMPLAQQLTICPGHED